MNHIDVMKQALEALEKGAYQSAIAILRAATAQPESEPVATLPERDENVPNTQQGLFRKFVVTRIDGSDHPGGKHCGCEYFVLDVTHDLHAKAALRAYAESCKTTHQQLSVDLFKRYGAAPVGDAPMTQDRAEELAHRRCRRYIMIDTEAPYQFDGHTLMDFVADVEKAVGRVK